MKTQKEREKHKKNRKKNRAGGIMLPGFRLYYNDRVIKRVWYCHKNRHIGGTRQSTEINPCTYGQLTYDKGTKTIQGKRDSLFSEWCWENWTATRESVK